LRRAELEYPLYPWSVSARDVQAFDDLSEGDQQQLSLSMRPYTVNLVLDLEAQQMRRPDTGQLLRRMVRAMRSVSPLWDF